MADTRTTSLLEEFLSINDSKAELTSRLKLREVSRLSQTCKSIRTLFKKPLDQLAAERLLDLAIKAEWMKIKNMVDVNPSLMFQPADGTDIDGTKIKCSPLHYLLYVHDYYGQEIFEIYAKKYNLLKEYLEHARAQKIGFDFQPFCQVYETYLTRLNLWKTGHSMMTAPETVLYKSWQKEAGAAQLNKLPRHMLRQASANGQDGWKLKSGFHVQLLFENISFAYYWYNEKIISHDLKIFKALFAMRKEQQLLQISGLEQELQILENAKRPSKNRSLL